MQQTSLEAWNSELDLGLKQKVVYDTILVHQPCTNKEISFFTGLPINCVTPRTKELRDMGLVIAGEMQRQKNGRNAVTWISKNKR